MNYRHYVLLSLMMIGTSFSSYFFPISPAFLLTPSSTSKVLTYSLTRMLMSRMLTRLGHQVTMAENGKIALGMIKDSHEGKPGVPKFDVCFLDK